MSENNKIVFENVEYELEGKKFRSTHKLTLLYTFEGQEAKEMAKVWDDGVVTQYTDTEGKERFEIFKDEKIGEKEIIS